MYRRQAASEADLVFVSRYPFASFMGLSVANIGDVNRDGYADIGIGVPGADMAVIVLGRRFQRAVFSLPITPAHEGVIVIETGGLGSDLGWSIAGAGDFNGDGVGDVIVGWPDANLAQMGDGAAVVVFGNSQWSTDSLPVTIAANDLGGAGFLLQGEGQGDRTGAAVAGGGDFNNDALADIVIAAPGAVGTAGLGAPRKNFPGPNPGVFYLVYGNQDPPATLNLDALSTEGFAVICPQAGGIDINTSNTVCAMPGDVNFDGFGDLLLGTPLYAPAGAGETGQAWVVFGRDQRVGQPIHLDDIPFTQPGIRIMIDEAREPNGHLGFSVAGVGDLNRDARADFAVSIPDATGGKPGGLVQVILGSSDLPLEILVGDPAVGYTIKDDVGPLGRFGVSISSAGDPNNDGLLDLVIGAPGTGLPGLRQWPAGHAYVVYSLPGVTTDTLLSRTNFRVANLVGVFGSRIPGAPGDLFGWSVCGPGDLNGDHVDDVLAAGPISRVTFDEALAPGNVYGFFFEPPIIRAAYINDPNGNGQADAGERINIVLNKRVRGVPGPAENVFFLANQGVLGPDSVLIQLQPRSNRLQIELGPSATDIVAIGPGTGLDFNALGPPNRVVSVELGVNPIDRGSPDVNDAAVDLRLPLRPSTGNVAAAAGGSVAVPVDPDSRYSGHRIEFGPQALNADAQVIFSPMPDPIGDFGFGSAVWITVSQPFRRARLIIGFDESDLPPHMSEYQMRIVHIFENAQGFYAIQRPPGVQTVDPVANTISVFIDSLQPPGLGPAPAKAQGSSGGFAGIPVDTVDERSVNMRPTGGAVLPPAKTRIHLASQPGKQAIVTLNSGPHGLYTRHKIVFYDFELASPGDVICTIRTPLLAERTYTHPIIGSQYFPDESEAIFTIETTDAAKSPVALTSRVDIDLQFMPSSNPNGASDCIDFDGVAGQPSQMRIVRSVQNPMTFVPNFVFVGGSQTVDTGAFVVRITGFTNLTDGQGKATYGAVVDSSATGAARWELYR